MQKKHVSLAVLLLATAVLLSGCAKKPDNQSAAVNQEGNQGQVTNQNSEVVNPSGSYSINELLTTNKPLKCTWKESVTAGKEVTNILYINGKKFYQDVTMGDVGHGFTISDSEYLYIWNDFSGAASKMKLAEVKTNPEPGQEKTQGTAGLDQKRDFICEGWVADDSIFTPPQDKSFKDMTEEVNQASQELKENDLEKAKQQMCDLCQKAPTQETRDECLKNAQCDQ